MPGIVAASDISVVGPLARSADDLAMALEAMAGPDAIDGLGWQLHLPRPRHVALRDYTVAVIYTDAEAEVDETVQARLHVVVEFLTKSGAQVSDTARPQIDSREAHRNYLQLLRSATSGRLSPERFQHHLQAAAALPPDADGYEAQSIRAQALYHKDWLGLNESRHRMRLAWAEFFKDYDLLLCPLEAVPMRVSPAPEDRFAMLGG